MMKQKNEKDDNKQIINKIIELELYYYVESSNLYLKHLENKLGYLNKMKKLVLDNEPIFPFKKAMKKWNYELEHIENQIYEVCQDINAEYKEIEKTMKAISNK